MSLCSVLRKVAAGTYIGGDLFFIYLGWLPNGTVTIARSFLHYTISTHKSYFGYGEADSRDAVIHLLDS